MDGMVAASMASVSLEVKPSAKKEAPQPSVARASRDPMGDEAASTTTATPRRELVDRPDGLASVLKEYAAVHTMSQGRDPAPSAQRSAT